MVDFENQDRFQMPRHSMVEYQLRGRDIKDIRVLETIGKIPRELFVTEKYVANAYDDNPLPIGMGQTISQPYIVALMTQCLELSGTEQVLEIGTGSGYQTALLAELANHVYTIERFHELSEQAQAVLGGLSYNNIDFVIGDGSCGWPDEMEFDRIIVTAALPEIPECLINQLKDDGIIVAPIGGVWSQDLITARRSKGKLTTTNICGCRFVKLIGQYGYSE